MSKPMTTPLFLFEVEFSLEFDGLYTVVHYETSHPKAKPGWVVVRRDYDDTGKAKREYGALMIRDSGDFVKKGWHRQAIVVRKGNDVTPIPDFCGELIGYVTSYGGRWQFYVFDAKGESQSASSSSSETTSPAPAAAPKTRSRPAEAPCPCVVSGTTTHEKDTGKTNDNGESLPWWESPDAPQSSVG